MTTYEKYTEYITTIDDSYEYLSVAIYLYIMIKEEILEENYYDTNILQVKNEINVDILDNEKIFIKEERNEEFILNDRLKSAPLDIKEENLQSGDTYSNFIYKPEKYDTNNSESQTKINVGVVKHEEFIIKEETSEELVLNRVKEGNPESDKTCKQTENIEENAQISDVSVSPLTENENICEEKDRKYKRKLFKCKICKESVRNLERHHLKHSTVRPYKCETCDKSFKTPEALKRHSIIHTDEKPYTCEVCNRSFRVSSSLNQHKLLHTGEKPFTCEICNKSFRVSSNLNQHKLIHTGEKPYTCTICDKSYRLLQHLKQHKLAHSNAKPYTCEVCNKSFQKSSNVNRHKLLHTGEKPYTCEVCNKSFGRLTNFKTHKLLHTGEKPFTCEVCKKSFRKLYTLNRHKLLHTGEKPHICEICNKSFRYLNGLKKHKNSHTTDDTPTHDS